MPILAGGIITAGQLARMQPVPYKAVASSALAGAVSNADVPGCSVTFTTQAPGAIVVAHIVCDFDPSGTVSTLSNGRLAIDGTGVGEYAVYQSAGAISDRQSTPQSYRETLGAAGSHTVKMIATLATNVTMNVYTTLEFTVYEVV
jgi:hypothetical protein